MSIDQYLPPNVERSQLAATIGLVSDTHMPLRRRTLPPNLGDILGGTDFLLHAGDVGELWVLDQLSAIAPVIAVHGNDDTDDAQRELPFQQIITVAGKRILLWHSHFPIWEEEMAFRQDDDLPRSIQRCVDQAQRAGANIVVFGHWHIPLVHRTDDLLIINPGALAAGNEFSRMLRNTVALLFIEKNGNAHVTHVDLAAPGSPFVPHINWAAGFLVAMNQFAKSILAHELRPAVHFMRTHFTRDEILAIRPHLAAKAMPIWEKTDGELTVEDVEDALVNADDLPPAVKSRMITLWEQWKASR